MIAYTIYKFLHVLGIAALMMALGGAMIGTHISGQKPTKARRAIAITHGVGMFLVLLGGFGMLARLGIHWPWPWWILLKVIVWIALGAWLAVAYRSATLKLVPLWLGTLLLVALAAGAVLMK
jgi:hypothetical protein